MKEPESNFVSCSDEKFPDLTPEETAALDEQYDQLVRLMAAYDQAIADEVDHYRINMLKEMRDSAAEDFK